MKRTTLTLLLGLACMTSYAQIDSILGFAGKFDAVGINTIHASKVTLIHGAALSGTKVSALVSTESLVFDQSCLVDTVQASLITAQTSIQARSATILPSLLNGSTLTPGTYRTTGDLEIKGTLTLSGNSSDEFIFDIAGDLIIDSNASFQLNTVESEKVLFSVSEEVEIRANAIFHGRVIAGGNIACSNKYSGSEALLSLDSLLLTIDTGSIGLSLTPLLMPDINRMKNYGILSGGDITTANPFYSGGKIGALGNVSGILAAQNGTFGVSSCDFLLSLLDVAHTLQKVKRLNGNVLPGQLSGMTLTPGSYILPYGAHLNGQTILSGDPSDVFIFRIKDSLLINSITQIDIGAITPANVFWIVEDDGFVAIDPGADLKGIIMANNQISYAALQKSKMSLFSVHGNVSFSGNTQLSPLLVAAFEDLGQGANNQDIEITIDTVSRINFCSKQTITIQVSNNSNDSLFNFRLLAQMDSLISYVANSVQGAGVSEDSVADHFVRFQLQPIGPSGSVSLSFKVSTNCESYQTPSIHLNLTACATDSVNATYGGFEQKSYTYLFPYLGIKTPLTFSADSGATVCRDIHLVNTGTKSLLEGFCFSNKHGNDLQVNSYELYYGGSLATTILPTYQGDTVASFVIDSLLLSSITGGTGIARSDTITVRACITVLGCDQPTTPSLLSYAPLCDAVKCSGQLSNSLNTAWVRASRADITINFVEAPDICYGNGNRSNFQLVLTNLGGTTASNLKLRLQNPLVSQTYFLNDSIRLINNGTIVKIISSSSGSEAKTTCLPGATTIESMFFSLPDTFTMAPGASDTIEFTGVTCLASDSCINPSRYRWGYQLYYHNACYGADSAFSAGPHNELSGSGSSYINEWRPGDVEGDTLGGARYELVCVPLAIGGVNDLANLYWPGSVNNDRIKFTFQLEQQGLNFDSAMAAAGSYLFYKAANAIDPVFPDTIFYTHDTVYVSAMDTDTLRIVEAYFDLDPAQQDSIFLNDSIFFCFYPLCPAKPSNIININWSYVPDYSCNRNAEVPLGCLEQTIRIHCPGCERQGPLNKQFNVQRDPSSFGMADINPCDGLPDASGSLDKHDVRFSNVMVGDTVLGYMRADFNFNNGYWPKPGEVPDTTFKHLYYEAEFLDDCVDGMQLVDAIFRISTPVDTIVLHIDTNLIGPHYLSTSVNATIIDLSIDSLFAFAQLDTSLYDHYHDSTQLELWPRFVWKRNIGITNNPTPCNIKSRFFAGRGPEPYCNEMANCKPNENTPEDPYLDDDTVHVRLCDTTVLSTVCDESVQFFCEYYTDKIFVDGYNSWLETGSQLLNNKSCCNYQFTIRPRFNLGRGSDVQDGSFINEYRHWARVDSIVAVLPPGFDYCTANLAQIAYSCGSDIVDPGAIIPSFAVEPDAVIEGSGGGGDTLHFYINQYYSNSTDTIPTGQLYKGSDGWNVTLTIQANIGCDYDDAEHFPNWHAWTKFDYENWIQADPDPILRVTANVPVPEIRVYQPELALNPPLAVLEIAEKEFCFDVVIENTVQNSIASNVWLKWRTDNGYIVPTLLKDQSGDLLTKLNDSIFILTTQQIPGNASRTIRVYGETDCDDLLPGIPVADSLQLIVGWDCPTDSIVLQKCPQDMAPFQLQFLTPLLSANGHTQLLDSLTLAVEDTINICDRFRHNVTLINNGEANAYASTFKWVLPTGFSFVADSAFFRYPSDSNKVVMAAPVINGDTLTWELDSLNNYFKQHGLPGSRAVSSVDSTEVLISLMLESDCQYRPDSLLELEITAQDFCQRVIPVINGNVAIAPGIKDFPSLARLSPVLNMVNFQACDTATSAILTFLNDDAGSIPSGPGNRFYITLPQGLSYVDTNQAIANHNLPTFVSNVNDTLCFAYSGTLAVGDSVYFAIDVAATGAPCNSFQLSTWSAIEAGLFCDLSNDSCELNIPTSAIATKTVSLVPLFDTIKGLKDTCQYTTLQLTANTCGEGVWEIAVNGTTVFASTADTIDYTFTHIGEYTVTHSIQYGCQAITVLDTVMIFDVAACCYFQNNLYTAYDIIDTILTETTVWDVNTANLPNPLYVAGTIEIEDGDTLTIGDDMAVFFGPYGKIVVQPGGVLIADDYNYNNPWLLSADQRYCNTQMWYGIEVWANASKKGKVLLAGREWRSVLEHAHIGVLAGRRVHGVLGVYYDHTSNGGIIEVDNIRMNNNAINIQFNASSGMDQESQIQNLAINYTIGAHAKLAGTLLDTLYNSNTAFAYPDFFWHPWHAVANPSQRTALGILVRDKNISNPVNLSRFHDVEVGIRTMNSVHDITNCVFDSVRVGIDIDNTVKSFYKHVIDNNSFTYFNNNSNPADSTAAIMITNGRGDVMIKNSIGQASISQSDEENGISILGSSGFSILNENFFSSLRLGLFISSSGTGGGQIGWQTENNQFIRNRLHLLTPGENPYLKIRCNTHVNSVQADFGSENWLNKGNFADQGQFPPKVSLIAKDKYGAGNDFQTNLQDSAYFRRIREFYLLGSVNQASYDYYHHTPETTDSTRLPTRVGPIGIYDIGYKFQANSCDWQQTYTRKYINDKLDSTKRYRDSIPEIIKLLDGGNKTSDLLEEINQTDDYSELKDILLAYSPLSDTVLLSFIQIQAQVPDKDFTPVITANSPVSRSVKPRLIGVLPDMGLDSANSIIAAQVDYLYAGNTVESFRKQMEFHAIDRQAAMNLYLDSLFSLNTTAATDTALDLLGGEGTLYAYKYLVAWYLATGDTVNSYLFLDSVPDTTLALQNWREVMKIQLDLKAAGKSLFEIDSIALETVETLAQGIQEEAATTLARSLLKYIRHREFGHALPDTTTPGGKSGTIPIHEPGNDESRSENQEFSFFLGNNIPNPFESSTYIPYKIPINTDAVIRIYSIRGALIRTIELDPQKRGIQIDLEDFDKGVYLYSLYLNNRHFQTKRMVLIE